MHICNIDHPMIYRYVVSDIFVEISNPYDCRFSTICKIINNRGANNGPFGIIDDDGQFAKIRTFNSRTGTVLCDSV